MPEAQLNAGLPADGTGNRLYAAMLASDILVAKALGVSEVAQIAKLEQRLRELYVKRWDFYSKKAIKAADKALAGKSAKISQAQVNRALKAIEREMKPWARDVWPKAKTAIDQAYRLARNAGARKAVGDTKASLSFDTPQLKEVKKATSKEAKLIAAFDLVDEAAVTAMGEHQLFWLGPHFADNVSDGIALVSKEVMIETGGSRVVAGRALSQAMEDQLGRTLTPAGFAGTSGRYFEGLAANAVTTARVGGQLRSFALAESKRYVIVNPSDERTCPTCGHMDDKSFTVEQGQRQMDATLAAETPDAVKAASPWLGTKGMLEISSVPGPASISDSEALAKAGFALPPFHFRCRCTVDVA